MFYKIHPKGLISIKITIIINRISQSMKQPEITTSTDEDGEVISSTALQSLTTCRLYKKKFRRINFPNTDTVQNSVF